MRKTYSISLFSGILLSVGSVLAQPVNDLICNATTLMPLGTVVSATNAAATATGSPAIPTGSCWSDGPANTNDVWFTFVAPAQTTGILRITTFAGANDDTQMQVWRASPAGSCTGTLTVVPGGCNDDISASNYMSQVNIQMSALVASETYFVQVDGWQGTVGSFTIQAEYLNPPPPLNYPLTLSSTLVTTYTDLGTDGTDITPANTDNATTAASNIGFTFSYNGSDYTQFRANTNGFLKLGTVAPSTDTLFRGFPDGLVNTIGDIGGSMLRNVASDSNILSIYNTDLIGNTGAEMRVSTTGSAPNRVCIIQWKNFKDKPKPKAPCSNTGATNCAGTATSGLILPDSLVPSYYDNMNFQIRLFEGSNIIEFVYDSLVPNPAFTNTDLLRSAEVGLKGRGITAADLNIVQKPSATAWGSSTFVTSTTQNIFNMRRAGAYPGPAGRTFRFIPPQANDAAVSTIMDRGKHPIPSGNPSVTHVRINNTGQNALTGLPVTLTVTGANPSVTVKTIATLASGTGTTVTFDSLLLTNAGVDTLRVTVPNDDLNQNNASTFIRTVGNSLYNYSPGGGPVTALGYGGTATAGFVQRFPIRDSAIIIKVRAFIFNTAQNLGNQVYAYVANSTGAILGQSAPVTITTANVNTWVEFPIGYQSFPVPSFNNTDAYTVLIQTPNVNGTASYFPLGVQLENPPRPGAPINLNAGTGPGNAFNAATFAEYRYMFEAELADPNAPNQLTAFNLAAPANSTAVQLQGAASTPVNITWTKSTDGGGLPVSYIWLADIQGGTFTPPLLQYAANNGGSDTVLTLTMEQIDDALALAGIPQNCQPFDLSWTVIAVAGANSRGASDTFDVSFARCGLQYVLCAPGNAQNTNDFIDSVGIAGDAGTSIQNKSGRNLPNQYINYYDSSNYWLNIASKGINYPFTIKMSLSPYPYRGYAYIDYDNNNRFDDAGGEFVSSFGQGDTTTQTIAILTGNINIPASIPDGVYRMRIVAGDTDGVLAPCEVTYGDVEDYRLYIGPFGVGVDLETAASIKLYPNPAHQSATIAYAYDKNVDMTVQLLNAVGQEVLRDTRTNTRDGRIDLNLDGVKPGMYFTRVAAGEKITTLKLIVE